MDRADLIRYREIINSGVVKWNRWRDDNPDVQPLLPGVDLSGKNLMGISLEKSVLYSAKLSKANLNHANCIGAEFGSADLSMASVVEADLANAHLRDCDLSYARLSRADLCSCDMERANLTYARLDSAALENADLAGANMTLADLSMAKLTNANLARSNFYQADLTEADLTGANLSEADFLEASLIRAKLQNMDLSKASFRGADFTEAELEGSRLSKTKLERASFRGANLRNVDFRSSVLIGVDFSNANMEMADLRGADLSYSIFVNTNLRSANMAGCNIYGISAWDLTLENANQQDLVIVPWHHYGHVEERETLSLDNLEVAQFIYLIIRNEKLRSVIDTIAKKAVLILGSFSEERKHVLEEVKKELRRLDYLPIIFDFVKPSKRDFTETISLLAGLSRFIIVDITEPRSVPQELHAIVPNLNVPVKPILQRDEKEYGMFGDFKKYPWVFGVYHYKDSESLVKELSAIASSVDSFVNTRGE
jgi:uncharacterized protein YjbI with pentapeptide repeats